MNSRQRTLLLLALFVGALALRLVAIQSEPLWTDEYYTYLYATSGSLTDVVTYANYTDPHPPTYYALMHVWLDIVPTTRLTMRLPTAFFGALAAPAAYLAAERLSDKRSGLYAGVLFAVAPRLVYHSQQARMYGLMLFLFTAALYATLWYTDTGSRKALLTVAPILVLAGYVHLYGLFLILTVNVVVLGAALQNWPLNGENISLVDWIGGQSCVTLMLLPWIGVVLTKIARPSDAAAWLSPPPIISPVFTFVHWGTYLRSGHIVQPVAQSFANNELLAVPIAMLLLVFLLSDRTEAESVLYVWIGLPVALSMILSHAVQPIYLNRYFVQAGVGFFVLIAVRLNRGVPTERVGTVLFVLLVISSVPALTLLYSLDENPPQGEVVEKIEQTSYPVLVESTHVEVGYKYHAERRPLDARMVDSARSARPNGSFWVYSVGLEEGEPSLNYDFVYNETHTEVRRIEEGRLLAVLYEPREENK